jgi:hypothetical protein
MHLSDVCHPTIPIYHTIPNMEAYPDTLSEGFNINGTAENEKINKGHTTPNPSSSSFSLA